MPIIDVQHNGGEYIGSFYRVQCDIKTKINLIDHFKEKKW